jgi:hypothetical protein
MEIDISEFNFEELVTTVLNTAEPLAASRGNRLLVDSPHPVGIVPSGSHSHPAGSPESHRQCLQIYGERPDSGSNFG